MASMTATEIKKKYTTPTQIGTQFGLTPEKQYDGTQAYKQYDYDGAYKAAEDAKRAALDAEYKSTAAGIETQGQQLGQQYNAERSGIYTAAKRAELADRETMAANGLGRGRNVNSGYGAYKQTEAGVNWRANIGNMNRAEQAQRDTLATQLLQAGYAQNQGMAEYLANAYTQKAAQQAQENQAAQQYAQNAYQYQQEYEAQTKAAQQQAEQWESQMKYQKAIDELNTYGKVMTKAAAKALGVKVGTTSLAYKQYQQQKKAGK